MTQNKTDVLGNVANYKCAFLNEILFVHLKIGWEKLGEYIKRV